MRIHADQFSCSGGALLAAELGAATADHLEHTDAASIAALAAAHVQPVLLPGSVYSIGSKHYPPARAMIDAGLAVVLATDFNPGSSPIASMPVVLSLACTQMKMTPAEDHYRGDHQRSLESETGQGSGLARAWQIRRLCRSRSERLPRDPLFPGYSAAGHGVCSRRARGLTCLFRAGTILTFIRRLTMRRLAKECALATVFLGLFGSYAHAERLSLSEPVAPDGAASR